MSDKLYPARWAPDEGFDEQDILYCHGDEYAFWINVEAEDWWGVELAKAINDAHDLRVLVREVYPVILRTGQKLPTDWLERAHTLLGDTRALLGDGA